MSSDLNVIGIVGRLARDAELKYTNTGTPVSNFSIASSKSEKGQDGQYHDVGHFFECVLWGKAAEALIQYLTKGQQLGIQGRLEQQQWVDKESGKNRSKVVINVREVELLASVKSDPAQYPYQNQGGQQSSSQAPQQQRYANPQQGQGQAPQQAPRQPQQAPPQAPRQPQYPPMYFDPQRNGYYPKPNGQAPGTPPPDDSQIQGPEMFNDDQIPF